MNFFTTLSEKLGFKPKENDEEREEDELEDDEEQDDEDEEEDEERPSRFSLKMCIRDRAHPVQSECHAWKETGRFHPTALCPLQKKHVCA